MLYAGDDAENSSLARAVGADQSDDFSRIYLQRDTEERLQVAVKCGYVFKCEQRRRGTGHSGLSGHIGGYGGPRPSSLYFSPPEASTTSACFSPSAGVAFPLFSP